MADLVLVSDTTDYNVGYWWYLVFNLPGIIVPVILANLADDDQVFLDCSFGSYLSNKVDYTNHISVDHIYLWMDPIFYVVAVMAIDVNIIILIRKSNNEEKLFL